MNGAEYRTGGVGMRKEMRSEFEMEVYLGETRCCFPADMLPLWADKLPVKSKEVGSCVL